MRMDSSDRVALTDLAARYAQAAHHIYPRGEGHRDNRIEIRYQDSFEKVDGTWLFSRRELVVDFAEDVPVILLGQ
jgi:hypothetical protein